MKKKLFALLAVLVLILCACGQTKEAQVHVQETTMPVTTANPTTEPTTVPTEPPKPWLDNVMMFEFVDYPGPQDVPGNPQYKRSQITEITILDTLADMPEDAWDMSEAQNGSVMAWVDTTDGAHLYIAGDGGVSAPADCEGLFGGYSRIITIHFNNAFHTENAVNCSGMFMLSSSLESLDLTGWDTSNVTNMGGMFGGISPSLEYLDLSVLDVSNVTDMSGMFGSSDIQKVNLTGWNTSNVITMERMFEDADSLMELDLSTWDVSSVTNMSEMFAYCDSLTSVNISGWDTSDVTDMAHMFNSHLATIQGVEELDVSNVTNMEEMFNSTYLVTLDLSKWDTSKVENMKKMFWWMPNRESIELGEWEIDSVTDYEGFLGNSSHMYKGEPWKNIFQK